VSVGIDQLMLGTVKSDANHADGTALFIETMNQLLGLQEGGLRLSAPAIDLTSVELIQRSRIKAGILWWAHSCPPSNVACGACRGCTKHREVIAGLGYEPF